MVDVIGEYNLAKMEQELIAKAYRMYPDQSHEFVADKLGITFDELCEKVGKNLPAEFNLKELEKRLIKQAIIRHVGEKNDFIAEKIGISSRNLFYKLILYGLTESKRNIGAQQKKSIEFNLIDLEKRLINKAIALYPMSTYSFIADKLGISEKTLYRKMDQYGIDGVKKIMRLEQKLTHKQQKFKEGTYLFYR